MERNIGIENFIDLKELGINLKVRKELLGITKFYVNGKEVEFFSVDFDREGETVLRIKK
jgi:hypothetical protein